MVNSIKPDDMSRAIGDILQTFNHTVLTATDEAAIDAAKKTVKELKATSPRRSGKYAKGWTYKKEKSGACIVYNKARPQLTHLLEKGHPVKGRGKTVTGQARAFPHIADAEETAEKTFIAELKNKIQKGN